MKRSTRLRWRMVGVLALIFAPFAAACGGGGSGSMKDQEPMSSPIWLNRDTVTWTSAFAIDGGVIVNGRGTVFLPGYTLDGNRLVAPKEAGK